MREGGLVGFGKHHLKIAWPPLSLPIFSRGPPPPPYSGHFLGWPPPQKKKLNKQYLDFNFFNISLLSPYFTFCAHCEDNIYNPYTTESCCLKNKSKEREVNFGSPSYGSPWACGIWPLRHLPHLNWWMQEWRHLSHLLPLSQWHDCYTHRCHFHPFHCCQRLPCCHFVSMSWHFSVLVGQFWEDSYNAFTFSLLLLFQCAKFQNAQ